MRNTLFTIDTLSNQLKAINLQAEIFEYRAEEALRREELQLVVLNNQQAKNLRSEADTLSNQIRELLGKL